MVTSRRKLSFALSSPPEFNKPPKLSAWQWMQMYSAQTECLICVFSNDSGSVLHLALSLGSTLSYFKEQMQLHC